MADVEITYGNYTPITMSDSGTELLETSGKWMPDNITVTYTKSGVTPTGTKNITISASGTTTEDVTNYASVAINVPAYAGAHHSAVSDYTVTVSLTNPRHSSEFTGGTIRTQLSSTGGDVGEVLSTITSPTASISVNVPSSVYGICIEVTGSAPFIPQSGISCSTGITYIGQTSGAFFEVTGDGTITLNDIDYDI